MAIYELKLPELGEGLHEGRIAKWLVKPGDTIKEDDAVAEVENDKSMVELPSPVDGKVVSLVVEEGTTAVVGDVLLTLEVAGEGNASSSSPEAGGEVAANSGSGQAPSPAQSAVSANKPAAAATTGVGTSAQPGPGVAPATASTNGVASGAGEPSANGVATSEADALASRAHDVLATPGVRKFARESGIDIGYVKGTGANGKVTREDVEKFMQGGNAAATVAPVEGVTAIEGVNASPSAQADNAQPVTQTAQAVAADTVEERIPLSSIRKIIAQAMAKSAYTAPHVTVMDEVDVTELVQVRKELKPLAEERGAKITYLPFIVKAMIAAIRKYPHLNASLDDERQELVVKHNYHIGIATDTERGLVVPVVRDADRKSMWTIAAEISDMAQRARTNKLGPAEMRGSTISITNIGSAGGMFFTPIINYPEVAILGVGRITEKPVMKNGEVVGAHMMALSLSFDHRIIDGVMGQNFVNEMKRLLENPRLLMMEV